MANTPSRTQQMLQNMTTEVTLLKDQLKTLRVETAAFSTLATKIAVLEHKVDELWKLHDSQRGTDREITTLTSTVDELKKGKDDQKKGQEERARRLWALTPNLTAAIITIILAPVSVVLWNILVSLFRTSHP